MKIKLTVELELTKQGAGPFVSTADVAEAAIEEIQSNIPSEVSVGDSTYEVVESSVTLEK